jgi:hypothetical protein
MKPWGLLLLLLLFAGCLKSQPPPPTAAPSIDTPETTPPTETPKETWTSEKTGASGVLVGRWEDSNGSTTSIDTDGDGKADYIEDYYLNNDDIASDYPSLNIETMTYVEDSKNGEVKIWINGEKKGEFKTGAELEEYLDTISSND